MMQAEEAVSRIKVKKNTDDVTEISSQYLLIDGKKIKTFGN